MFGLNTGRRQAAVTLNVLVIALAILGLAALPAAAQGTNLTIDQATLRVLPEYDDPGLLVIFYGSFTGISAYPQQVTFNVPAAARDLQTTEQESASQTLLLRTAQRQGDQITYSLETQPRFQIEYYLDRQPSGNERTVNYTWRAPYAIKSLTITTEQPQRASNFSLTPKEDSTAQGADGLTTYQLTRTNLAAGQEINLTMRYTKTDAAPSFARTAPAGSQGDTAAAAAPDAAAAAANAAPAQGRTPPVLALVLIGVGLAALAGAGVYWFLERRPVTEPAMPARGSRRSQAVRPARPAGAAADQEETHFCRKCGRPYAPGDRFCGSCGTPRGA